MHMIVIDSDGEWWINTAAFRMADSTRLTNPDGEDIPENHEIFAFESGVKYKIRPTAWMLGQPTLVKTDDVDTAVLDLVQIENVSRDVQVAQREEAKEAQAPTAKKAKK